MTLGLYLGRALFGPELHQSKVRLQGTNDIRIIKIDLALSKSACSQRIDVLDTH